MESELMCTFTIGYTDMFGSSVTKELKDNGANIAVTNDNRKVKKNTSHLMPNSFYFCKSLFVPVVEHLIK